MASFGDRITGLTGLNMTASVTGLVTQWLTDATKDVINVLPPEILYIASGIVSVPPQFGYTDAPNSRILEVVRMGDGDPRIEYECREIDSALRGKAEPNSGYVEEATVESPVFWRRNGAIYVLPIPTVSEIARVTHVIYPHTVSYDVDSIPRFPNEIEQLVVLKAAVSAKFYQIGQANTEEDVEIATSHTNHMSAINQEYTMCLQNFMSGYQMNVVEQGA